MEREKLLGKEYGGTKKKEAPVLVLHRIPAKHMEHIHMQLAPVSVT